MFVLQHKRLSALLMGIWLYPGPVRPFVVHENRVLPYMAISAATAGALTVLTIYAYHKLNKRQQKSTRQDLLFDAFMTLLSSGSVGLIAFLILSNNTPDMHWQSILQACDDYQKAAVTPELSLLDKKFDDTAQVSDDIRCKWIVHCVQKAFAENEFPLITARDRLKILLDTLNRAFETARELSSSAAVDGPLRQKVGAAVNCIETYEERIRDRIAVIMGADSWKEEVKQYDRQKRLDAWREEKRQDRANNRGNGAV